MRTLYPDYATQQLRDRFGLSWAAWIDVLQGYPRVHPDVIAYQVVLLRLARGQRIDAGRDPLCVLTACAILDGYHGDEITLLRTLAETGDEVRKTMLYLNQHQQGGARQGVA